MNDSVYIRVFDLDETPIITLQRKQDGKPDKIGPLFDNPEIYNEWGGMDVTAFTHFLLNNRFEIVASSGEDVCHYLYELSPDRSLRSSRGCPQGSHTLLGVTRRICVGNSGMSAIDGIQTLYNGALDKLDWADLNEKASEPKFDEPVRFLVEVQCNRGTTNVLKLANSIRGALTISHIHKVEVVEEASPFKD